MSMQDVENKLGWARLCNFYLEGLMQGNSIACYRYHRDI